MPVATAKRNLSQEAPNAVLTECFWKCPSTQKLPSGRATVLVNAMGLWIESSKT